MKNIKTISTIILLIFIGLGILILTLNSLNIKSNTTKVNNTNTTETSNVTTSPTTVTTPTSSTSTTTSNSNKCIIAINGKNYDVTTLEYTHSGGNVFNCGQDNTSIFYSQHNTNFLNRNMSRYHCTDCTL